jgi:hypothetical protein
MTVVVATARDPSPYLAHLRRLERAGCPVVVALPCRRGRCRASDRPASGGASETRWTVADGRPPGDDLMTDAPTASLSPATWLTLRRGSVESVPVAFVVVAEAA